MLEEQDNTFTYELTSDNKIKLQQFIVDSANTHFKKYEAKKYDTLWDKHAQIAYEAAYFSYLDQDGNYESLIQPTMLAEDVRYYVPDGKSLYVLEEFEGFTLYDEKDKKLNYPTMELLSKLVSADNPTPPWIIDAQGTEKEGYRELSKDNFFT
ncbi:MAG: hypothetical protein GF383_12000 [Candidatus Lokiarchaeota archaeon]|nr:hypothetical protein [Candidatus Lokiarchaeota archaeon]MBD3341608.1 hypothetical protein [Candidatus Lokiarchaeota archaeon]